MYSIPHLKSCFWKKIRVFFATPSNLGFFDTFSGASPDLQKARRLATSRPPLEDSVLFYFSLGGLFISEIVRSVPSW